MQPMTLTRAQFLDRVTSARHGDRIIYHVGFLHGDRQRGSEWGTTQSEQIDHVAIAAFKTCEQGHVHLFQRRLGDGTYEYIAQKIDPAQPFEWVGCYNIALHQYVRPKLVRWSDIRSRRAARPLPPVQEAA